MGSSARSGFRVSFFESRVRLQASGFRFFFKLQVSGFGLSGFRLLGFGLRASGFGLQDSGFWLLASGLRLQDFEIRIEGGGTFRERSMGVDE